MGYSRVREGWLRSNFCLIFLISWAGEISGDATICLNGSTQKSMNTRSKQTAKHKYTNFDCWRNQMRVCVCLYTFTHVSPQGYVETPPHAESNECRTLMAHIKSEPLLFNIEPNPPHSMVVPTENTKLVLAWLIELLECPPTSTKFHKPVPPHQTWWSSVLILV